MIKTLSILLAVGLVGPAGALGQIAITSSGTTGASTYALDGSPYTQTFDTLPASGTFTWANNSTLPGWSAADGNGTLNTTARAVNGTGTNPNDLTLYSAGTTTGSDERALAYHTRLASSPTHLGLEFVNHTGQAITSFSLAYSAEQWKEGTNNRTVAVTVEYRVAAALADLHVPNGWIALPGLGHSTLNGSAPATTLLTAANIQVNVPAGATLWVRWIFTNTATSSESSHDTLAIDNVTFSATAGTPVATAPAITTHPAPQSSSVGGTASFTVAATGTAPLSYQWRKNTVNLDTVANPSAGSATLSLTNLALADSGGSYDCVVTNTVDSATSNPATLTIGTPPPATGYSKYNLTGFATLGSGTTGGGVIPETHAAYRKCATPLEFVTAVRDSNKTANAVKVIEITANLNLGWNEIDPATKALTSNPIHEHAAPKLHPTLIASGVSVIDIVAKSGLTIFSANGATIKHVTFNIKSTSNIIVRNLKFHEMWEWDEATKGDYDSNDWDFMVLSNGGSVSNVWIDHCTFTKAYDGIADMKKGTQNITLSWCKYIGDDGATNANSHVRQQIAALEANKGSYAFYNFLRTNGFSQEDIVQVIQGHDKGHLMGATEKDAQNNVLSATFHHQWFTNLWDRCVPRLRGGQVHNYNILVDNTTALVARRMRDARANAMSSTARATLNATYSFNPFLNGSISTEGGAILVEKSIYQDCITPLRNNQTDITDPTYTGKIKSTDSIYIMHNTNGTTTTVRGDSTDAGNPMGPFQAPAIPFSWNTTDGNRPYPAPPMDDPSDLPAILTSGAGAGVLTWPKENWLLTSYTDTVVTDTFEEWSTRNGVSGPHDDSDRDGTDSLMEFALGMNPQQASTQGLPVLSNTAGQRIFRFTRPNNLGGLTYTVQTSIDLVDWSSTLATTIESSTTTTETLVAMVPQDPPERFVKLRILQQ